MSGIFNTEAVFIADINLVIQIISFVMLLAGLIYKIRGRFKMHGSFMGIAVFLHLISFLLAMGPSFLAGFELFTTNTLQTVVQTMWIHAISGAVSLILGFFLIIAWIPKPSNIGPCFGRKRIMDATIILWSISLAFGIVTYIIFYI